MTLTTRTLTALATLTISATVTVSPAIAAYPTEPTPANTVEIIPCVYEDSSDCYWDAQESGNGVGHSFDALRVGNGQVCIRFWDAAYDKREGYCTEDAYPEGDDRKGFDESITNGESAAIRTVLPYRR